SISVPIPSAFHGSERSRLPSVLAARSPWRARSLRDMPRFSPAARSDLVPTGSLRAGINHGNVILAKKDPASGKLSGVHVDLVRELGARMEVPVDLVGYE